MKIHQPMQKYSITIFMVFIVSLSSYAQITIQNTQTPVEIVENVLLGTGVTVSNIQWNGSANAANTVKTSLGEFSGTSNIGISIIGTSKPNRGTK